MWLPRISYSFASLHLLLSFCLAFYNCIIHAVAVEQTPQYAGQIFEPINPLNRRTQHICADGRKNAYAYNRVDERSNSSYPPLDNLSDMAGLRVVAQDTKCGRRMLSLADTVFPLLRLHRVADSTPCIHCLGSGYCVNQYAFALCGMFLHPVISQLYC